MKIWLGLADPNPDRSNVDPSDLEPIPLIDPPDTNRIHRLGSIHGRSAAKADPAQDLGSGLANPDPIQGRIGRFFDPCLDYDKSLIAIKSLVKKFFVIRTSLGS